MAARREKEADAARHRQEKREATRLGNLFKEKSVIVHGRVEFCEATTVGLVDEPKKSLYGSETNRDLRSACRYVA